MAAGGAVGKGEFARNPVAPSSRPGKRSVMTLPNFYLIGAPKAGTTSLYAWLSAHPEVFLPKLKEPHFLQYRGPRGIDAEIAVIRSLGAYEGQFRRGEGMPAVGEGSTMTYCFPEAAQRVRELTPEARFVMLLRQPAGRAWSHFHFRVAMGRENARTFVDALRSERTRRAQEGPVGSYYLHLGRYAHHLRPWLDSFPRERFHFVLFEEMRERPQDILRDVLGFLGVDASAPIDAAEKRNVGQLPASRTFAKAMKSRGPLRRGAAAVLPSGVKRALYGLHHRNRRAVPEMPP